MKQGRGRCVCLCTPTQALVSTLTTHSPPPVPLSPCRSPFAVAVIQTLAAPAQSNIKLPCVHLRHACDGLKLWQKASSPPRHRMVYGAGDLGGGR